MPASGEGHGIGIGRRKQAIRRRPTICIVERVSGIARQNRDEVVLRRVEVYLVNRRRGLWFIRFHALRKGSVYPRFGIDPRLTLSATERANATGRDQRHVALMEIRAEAIRVSYARGGAEG